MNILYSYLHCPWCWKRLHMMRWFPANWTSTICPGHAYAIRLISAQRKAARIQAAQMEVG